MSKEINQKLSGILAKQVDCKWYKLDRADIEFVYSLILMMDELKTEFGPLVNIAKPEQMNPSDLVSTLIEQKRAIIRGTYNKIKSDMRKRILDYLDTP